MTFMCRFQAKRCLVAALAMLAALTATRGAQAQTGACCVPSGGLQTCTDVSDANTNGTISDDCAALGGAYQGDDSFCGFPGQARNICVTFERGQNGADDGGFVNVSGATLFRPFFENQAATNDFINADGDTITRGAPCNDVIPFAGLVDADCNTSTGTVPDGLETIDQLAPTWTGTNCTTRRWKGYWLLQYRSVGSLNGVAEFVNYQLTGEVLNSGVLASTGVSCVPAEVGLINRGQWANLGNRTNFGCIPGGCPEDANTNGTFGGAACPTVPTANEDSGTPVALPAIDIGSTDVPMTWAAVGPDGTPKWNRKPTEPGYGRNPTQGFGTPGLFSHQLVFLNRGMATLNLAASNPNPDAFTVYDTQINWSPIGYITTRGTGVQRLKITELQHLFVTGRLPNGENLVAATRDSGSGTRNGMMNTTGIDASWGVGDNTGGDNANDALSRLGPNHQPTNCNGSGIIENVVRNRRIAVGYTGLGGSGRAVADARAGLYEIVDTMNDNVGGTAYVRPTIAACLNTIDPNTAFRLGGPQTLASVGDPLSDGPGGGPNDNPEMENLAARNWLRNIIESIAAFNVAPTSNQSLFTPGQYLAVSFFLNAGMQALPQDSPPDPIGWVDQTSLPTYVPGLNSFILANNGWGVGADTPAFGARILANFVPRRTSPGSYSDGSTNGNYYNFARTTYNVDSARGLNLRNRLMGDFHYGATQAEVRNLWDIEPMMRAICNPGTFVSGGWTGTITDANTDGTQDSFAEGLLHGPGTPESGAQVSPVAVSGVPDGNYVIPEIIGDFNGDGNFNSADIRYFADGLAMDDVSMPGMRMLDRKAGFTRVDLAWAATSCGAGNVNYFGTTFPASSTPKTYAAGDSRGDVNGRDSNTDGLVDGSFDANTDGTLDDLDYALVRDVNTNGTTDNPSDVNAGGNPVGADTVINHHDINYVYRNFSKWSDLDSAVTNDLSCDMNGDLIVDQNDVNEMVLAILCTNYGDANLDRVVDAADQAILTANLGSWGGWQRGDFDGDGVVTAADQAILTANLGASPRAGCSVPKPGDLDGDNDVDAADCTAFIARLLDTSIAPWGYAKSTVSAANLASDLNGDGEINGCDIEPFLCRTIKVVD